MCSRLSNTKKAVVGAIDCFEEVTLVVGRFTLLDDRQVPNLDHLIRFRHQEIFIPADLNAPFARPATHLFAIRRIRGELSYQFCCAVCDVPDVDAAVTCHRHRAVSVGVQGNSVRRPVFAF